MFGNETSSLDQNHKLVIGPLNTAGQAFQWTNSCRQYLGIDAVSFAGTRRSTKRIDGPSHKRSLHHRVRPELLKNIWARTLLHEATHFLDESFTTITGDQRFVDFRHDLSWIQAKEVSVGVLFHGSEIRSPSRHIEFQKFSYYRLMQPTEVKEFENATALTRQLAKDSGLPLFVSTPDLLQDLPEATWLPVVTDISKWKAPSPALSGRKLRVLHVPSRRSPPIKGTSFIDPIMKRLSEEGIIEYVSPIQVSHEEMLPLVHSVDVVIDQILSGFYGVAAIEAMASERLVVGNLGSDVREILKDQIPIIDSEPEDLELLIRSIASDPNSYRDIAAAGPAFVEKFHSGFQSALVLGNWMNQPFQK